MAEQAIIEAMVQALAKAAVEQHVIDQNNLPYFVAKLKAAFLSVNGGTVNGNIIAKQLTATGAIVVNGWMITVEDGT